MLHVFLWPIFAVWVGLALVVFVGIMATLAASAVMLLRDLRGVAGGIWCPLHHARYRIVGVASGFLGRPWHQVRRCQRFGDRPVRCRQMCVRVRELALAARTN